MLRKLFGVIFGLGILSFSAAANATIISATSATINSGGPGSGSINDTFNQAGLLTGYTSGVTDFNTYIAGNPQHTLVFSGNEWFSQQGSSASVTYDLGGLVSMDALALWNEDADGIGSLNLLHSADGTNFFPLLSGLTPTNNPINVNYGPDVFSFSAITAQFIRLDMSNCPQSGAGSFGSCAIGEVAFRQSGVQIPAPGTLAILGFGLTGLALMRRRMSI